MRAKLPGCATASRVFFLEDPPFNRDWMLDSISEAESLELAAVWLILRLRANQSVDPGLTAPVWYPAQLLGYSTPTLTDRFDYLRMQALRVEPRGAPPYRMLDCFVSAGRVRSHQSLKKTTKRKLAREVSRKGTPAKQTRNGGHESSPPQQGRLRPEDSMDAVLFEIAIREFIFKAELYVSRASKISTHANLATSQAQAETLALQILSSCNRRDTEPPDSEIPEPSASSSSSPMVTTQPIKPFNKREGLNERQAKLAVEREMIRAGRQPEGTGATIPESDTVSLGTGSVMSDVTNLLDVSQDPMEVIWAGEVVNVPDGNVGLDTSQPPAYDDVVILNPQGRQTQAASVEQGVTTASNGQRGRKRPAGPPPSQTASAETLTMPPPSTPVTFGSLDIRRGNRGRGTARPTTPRWRRGSSTRPPVTLHTPETGHSEPYNAGITMSSRGSGGNSESMGRRGRGMGQVVYGNVHQVEG